MQCQERKNNRSQVKTTIICPCLIKTGMFEEGMQGILKYRKVVSKPFIVFLPPITKALFPHSVMDMIVRLSRLNKSI
jgi:hypothetical protein